MSKKPRLADLSIERLLRYRVVLYAVIAMLFSLFYHISGPDVVGAKPFAIVGSWGFGGLTVYAYVKEWYGKL